MLSISPVKNANYYIDLAKKDDYYLDDGNGEPPGLWLGKGSIWLNLEGEVSKSDYQQLLNGFSPDGLPLVQNAGDDGRRKAWDLTFSAPKAISLIWAGADKQLQNEIESAQQVAVEKAIEFIERHAAVARRGEQSRNHERAAGLVVAAFPHCTSRAQDPQLHHHALICNAAPRQDGSWGTIESRKLYQWQLAAGSIYRAELAAKVRKLGFSIEQDSKSFHIPGILKTLCDYFSKRAQDIMDALDAKGITSSASHAGDYIKLSTREHKHSVDRPTLFKKWRNELDEQGFTRQQLEELQQEQSPVAEHNIVDEVVLSEMTKSHSTFREQDVYALTAQQATIAGLNASEAEQKASSILNHPDVVALSVESSLSRLYTTRQMLETEQSLINDAKLLAKESRYAFSTNDIEQAAATAEGQLGFEFDDEQRDAIHAALGAGDFAAIQGSAGAGKTTLLNAVHHIYDHAGLSVLGACVTKKAANNLQQESGIKSQTVASLITAIEDENKPNPLRYIDTLVVDEAGQIPSTALQQLLSAAKSTQCKVILTGEDRQLDAIQHGGALRYLSRPEVLGTTRIQTIRRQKEAWARQAVADLRDGNAYRALKAINENQLLKWGQDKNSTHRKLIQHWHRYQQANPEKPSLIIAQRWSDVKAIGDEVRRILQSEGRVGDENIAIDCHVADRTMQFKFSQGDRIKFCHNDYRDLNVTNGTTGTIQSIQATPEGDIELTVLVDDQRTLTFCASDYANQQGQPYLAPAYASTVFSSQGMTIDGDTFVLYNQGMDRANTYVAASRHKERCHLFCNEEEIDGLSGALDSGESMTAEERLKALAQNISQDRYKVLATEYLASQPEQQHNHDLQREPEYELD
ncbi:MAG: relaxase domain-containing protein [Candidatus Thiodiazotropha sp.]|nr:relaxase domain-containing protein [Candidatus Thiodiazotropha sp.]